jgi:hypothetical protein
MILGLLFGLITFCIAVITVYGSAYGAGFLTARVVKLPSYCLFDVQPQGTVFQRTTIWVAAMTVPLVICLVVFFLSALMSGIPVPGNVITVLPNSPAEKAGVTDGDRVTAVDGILTPDFTAVRREIQLHQGRLQLTIEREGRQISVPVTPNDEGRVGLVPEAGGRMPTAVEAGQTAFADVSMIWKTVFDAKTTTDDLQGPIVVVSLVGSQPVSLLWQGVWFAAVVGCVLWFGLPGVFLTDWLTGFAFHRRLKLHKCAIPGTENRDRAMDRRRFALWVPLCLLIVLSLWEVAEFAGLMLTMPLAIRVVFPAMTTAIIPLVWLISRALFGKGKALGLTALVFIPLVNIVVVSLLLRTSKVR